MVLSRQRRPKALVSLRFCAGWSAPLLFVCNNNRISREPLGPQFFRLLYFRMAEASTIGFTTDSVDGKSSTMHAASDQLIDPYCELCYENKGEKVASWCFCKECNLCLCTSCYDVHKQVPSLRRHQILHGSKMPRSLADKPIKYPDCELHIGNINDRYCREHHEMLCSECLKQNH